MGGFSKPFFIKTLADKIVYLKFSFLTFLVVLHFAFSKNMVLNESTWFLFFSPADAADYADFSSKKENLRD